MDDGRTMYIQVGQSSLLTASKRGVGLEYLLSGPTGSINK